MLTSSSRLRYYYENILRQDLLLKLNYANIMQVPRLCKINILSKATSYSIKSVSLALEIICGQMKEDSRHGVLNTTHRSSQKNFLALRAKKKGALGGFSDGLRSVRTSLRSTSLMYNFLEKLITIISFYDYTLQIEANTIQITLGTQVRLFPEIQNHFEFFESFQNLQVIIVTSALTENETQLLWTGLNQKEI